MTVRTPDGKRRTFEVGKGLYDKAKPGTTGRAQMWRGRVTLLTVGAESKRISLFPGFFVLWLVAWAGMMLFIGALFYPIGEASGQVLTGGHVVGGVVVYLLRDWPAAVLGVPALVAVAIAVLWVVERPNARVPW
ncbi:hypothetical protein [Actinomadura miaoliensis]|uniref:Uncharacterized protein n=1 Tax=Actinomadura miaoliensis TaxID=430685 RepID=A0ABP7X462_9ACTN